MNPGEIRQHVALALHVANSGGDVRRIVGDLIIVPAHAGHEPELVSRVLVENQRNEPTSTPHPVVQHLRPRRSQCIIAAIPIHTREVSEALRVIAEIDLIVGLMERAIRGVYLYLSIR